MEHLLREIHHSQPISSTAPIFLAAVIEYLTAKVLELANREAQNRGQRRITPQIVDMAIHNNSLLSALFQNATISQVAPAQR